MPSNRNRLIVGAAAAILAACSEPTTRVLPLAGVQLTVVSGNGQVGSTSRELPQPLVVRVTGMNNKGIRGLLLNFRVTSGGGRMYAGAALTDADGVAHDYWTLGPTAGAQQVDVVAVDPATGKQNYGSFQATALAPASLSITPSSASFGNVSLGGSSGPQLFTVRNVGDELSGPVGIAIGGAHPADFAIGTNTCAAALPGNATCTVTVAFAPNAAGARNATVTAMATPGGAAPATLSGTGLQVPVLTFSPASYTFGTVVLNVTSPSQNFLLTNTGSAPAVALNLSLGGANGADFVILGTACVNGMTLNPGQSCGGAVAFRPTAAGARAGTLVAGAGGGIVGTAPLTGTGLGVASLTISPTSFNFGTVIVGNNSAQQGFTILNNGTGTTGTLSATIAGTNPTDFTITGNTCTGATLIPGGSCSVGVRFNPVAIGGRGAALNVSGTPGGVASASLSGTGGDGTILTVLPSTLNFGNVLVGQSSSPSQFTVRNDGAVPATLAMGISGTGATAFVISADNCTGVTLGPTATCTLLVAFAPTSGGAHTATLFSGTPGTGLASLSGTGVTPPLLVASPPSQNFGLAGIGVPSRSYRILIQNTGGLPTGSIGVAVTGPNAQEFVVVSNQCAGLTLGPAASCAIDIVFTPSAAGARSATLSVSAAPGGSLGVALTGTGS